MSEPISEEVQTDEVKLIYHYVKSGDQEVARIHTDSRGVVVVMHGAHDLPPGSLVTITVRVGPEAAPQAAEPEPPAKARFLGQGRINQGGAA